MLAARCVLCITEFKLQCLYLTTDDFKMKDRNKYEHVGSNHNAIKYVTNSHKRVPTLHTLHHTHQQNRHSGTGNRIQPGYDSSL